MSISSVNSPRPARWWQGGTDGSITLTIRVQPGAKRSEVAGVYGNNLKIRLAAPAIEGKANAALKAYLAEAFAVPERAVTLVRGTRSRCKVVRVATPQQRPDWIWVEQPKP